MQWHEAEWILGSLEASTAVGIDYDGRVIHAIAVMTPSGYEWYRYSKEPRIEDMRRCLWRAATQWSRPDVPRDTIDRAMWLAEYELGRGIHAMPLAYGVVALHRRLLLAERPAEVEGLGLGLSFRGTDPGFCPLY